MSRWFLGDERIRSGVRCSREVVQSIESTVLSKGVAGMEQVLEAVFENGTFRLLEPSAVTLVDGQHVRLTVETEGTPDDILTLA